MHTTHVFSMKTSPEDSSSNASTGGALGSNSGKGGNSGEGGNSGGSGVKL